MSESRKGCQVVICDDEPAFRQIASVVLSLDPDVEVVGEAADGREAIRVVGKLRPDVLLLDIAMPEMDGLEAMPHILEASPETRIVVLTGMVAQSVRQRALDSGARRFIEKGIDIEDLVAQVKEVCGEPAKV